MTTTHLLFRSILHYWRTNLAVLLGVIAGTAVIGGALIVGDSVRGSLRQMTLDRLGEIDHVLHGHRFFRESLADELAGRPEFGERFAAVAPALILRGALTHESDSITAGDVPQRDLLRAGRVNVYGVDGRLWEMTEHGDVPPPEEGEVVLSRRVADQLSRGKEEGVQVGDTVQLTVELPTSIPRDSLLGKRDRTSQEVPFTVSAILDEASGVGRLNLDPNQQSPANAFVALGTLQAYLDLAEVRPSRRSPVHVPARVNALFVQAKSMDDGSPQAVVTLNDLLSRTASLADFGMRLVPNANFDYLSLESEQQMVEEVFVTAGEAAAEKLALARSPVLVYLANEIARVNSPERISWYSVIAGLDLPDGPPFGPFEFIDEPVGRTSQSVQHRSDGLGSPSYSHDIVLNEWLAKDIGAELGDEITVKYHLVGSHGELPVEQRRFIVRGIVRLDGTPAADRGLTPEVKGITDANSFSEWEQPFPMKLPVPDRDEDYWDEHRATPKAFVSLATAQELWQSRYGPLTSLRVGRHPDRTLDETADEFTRELLANLAPDEAGLSFRPVKYEGLRAADGTTDFSGLFIGFSFFLILSATILIGLLFRLGIERRAQSVGLLSAVGFTPRQVRRLFLGEGLLVVVIGGLLGCAAAVGYASLMVYGLTTWWFGAIGTQFLDVYVTPQSLAIGFAASVAVAAIAVWWGMRQLRSLSARELLSGMTHRALSEEGQRRRGRFASKVGLVCTAVALVLLVGALTGLVPATEAFGGLSWQVVAFFLMGMGLLAAGLAFLSAWLDSDRSAAVRGAGLAGMGRLGMRNAARHRQRSVLTVGLIASATFVIVAVAAGRRDPTAETPIKDSGNGGFTLVAETTVPMLYNLNTPDGRNRLDLLHADGSPEASLLGRMRAMPFRVKPGEDASCLNIYQTRLPTVLGATPRMLERGGFQFVGTREENPWTLLRDHGEENGVPVYPVFGDMNTLQFSLKKGIGDTITYPDDENPQYKLRVAGMFDGSVFQGVLVMAEENFLRIYPERDGYEYFLVEVDPAEADELARVLEGGLTAYGFYTERVAERIAGFLAVQNTYLSTFQTLGGLGLLLGTLGLATVMLRNVLERRSELALLRAVGFREMNLAWLVLWENAFLLLWGLTAGTVSALLAMTPHLTGVGADVPWPSILVTLAAVFAVGTVAALLAVREAVRTPIVATLRSE